MRNYKADRPQRSPYVDNVQVGNYVLSHPVSALALFRYPHPALLLFLKFDLDAFNYSVDLRN